MRGVGSSVFVASFVGAVGLASTARAQSGIGWEIVGSPGISDGPVMCCEIAADRAGNVFVAYQDDSIGTNPASVMRFQAGDWQFVGPQGGASIRQAWYNHLAFDTAGTAYLVCRDYGVNGKINVRRNFHSDGAWSDVGAPGHSADEAHYTDIAVDTAGVPYVVYADRSTTPPDRASVLRFVNGHWQYVGAPGVSAAKADYPSIAVDPSGRAVIAFSDRSHDDASHTGCVSVMRFDPATNAWGYLGAPGFTPGGGLNVRLAFDNHGTPHVAYQRYHSSINVWKLNGTQWVQVGGPASGFDHPTVETEPWRQWLSLDFDSQNAPYVAYQRLDDQNKAAVRKFDGQSWVAVGALGFTPPNADYMAMAVDDFDVPWVVFRDSTQGGRATVMRYAPTPYSYCTPTTDSLGCVPRIAVNGTRASGSVPFDVTTGGVISRRTGVLIYGYRPARHPFPGAFLCVAPPYHTVGSQPTGGSPNANDCTGSMSFDFSSWIRSGIDPGLVPGKVVFAQFWYRDPWTPARAGLTDAVRFEIGL